MSGARSRRKGAVGERELAAVLTAEGFDARRGQQHRGGPDSPDVIVPSLPRIHFEAKRCERLNMYDAIGQAKRDAGDKLPIVAHRRNAHEWLAIMPLGDLLAILRESSYVDTISTPATMRSKRTARWSRLRRGIPDHDLEAVEVCP